MLAMLEEIGTVDRIPECVARAKSKTDPFRLMGFGHRVYKQMDPRARLMRDMCHKLLDHLKIKDPLLDLAMELEKVALSDDYFIPGSSTRTWTSTAEYASGRLVSRGRCSR